MRARFRYLNLKYVLPAGPISTSFMLGSGDYYKYSKSCLSLIDQSVPSIDHR